MSLILGACSKRCAVNGCRVRMDHRHGGKKFKSKIRPWYAFQNPRVGRDYKRDKNPDKIPWDAPMIEEPDDEVLLASSDTTGLGYDEFGDDPFFVEDDSAGMETDAIVPQDTGGKKKKKKKRKGEEEVVQQVKKDPWDIENISDEPEEEEEEIVPEEETETEKEEKSDTKDKKSKKDKKKEKEEEKQKREELEEQWAEEEEEEDDEWGF